MNIVFAILGVQALMGAFDNLWHHELEARLPSRVAARYELTLHAMREVLYGVLFLGLAWFEWRGVLAWVLAGILALEIVITLADFVEEDLSRRLPPLERVLHTLLAVSYGGFVMALAPVLVAWAAQPTALVPAAYGVASWAFTLGGVGVLAWSLRNAIAVVRLGAVEQVAPFAAGAGREAVLVTGGTGTIGSALVRDMVAAGERVIVLTRDARQAAPMFGPAVWLVETLDAIPSETRIGGIVNLAGAPILGGRWTARRRRVLLGGRIDVTRGLVELVRRLEVKPHVLVSASAVGFYGARDPAERLDETATPRPGCFQSDLCAAWEFEAGRARAAGVGRVVTLRLGLVLARDGGAFPPLALAGRLGLGAVLGSGRQAVSWIHRDDAVGLIRYALRDGKLDGPVNATAPEVVDQCTFAEATANGRAVRIAVPASPLRWALGEAAELLLDGQRAVSGKACAAGFSFAYPRLEGAIRELVGASAKASEAPPAKGLEAL